MVWRCNFRVADNSPATARAAYNGFPMKALAELFPAASMSLISLALALSFAPPVALSQDATDLIPVRINNMTGFIDPKGRLVIPAEYRFAWGFSEGLASAW